MHTFCFFNFTMASLYLHNCLCSLTDRSIDRYIGRQPDRQTDRQIQIQIQIDKDLDIYIQIYIDCDSLLARPNSHCKAWTYKKKKHKKIKAYWKSLQKEPTVNRVLLILDLKPFRSQVKRKHSTGKEFQSPAVQEKKQLTQTFL